MPDDEAQVCTIANTALSETLAPIAGQVRYRTDGRVLTR